jgi:xanthine dehydrogenase accessory factor
MVEIFRVLKEEAAQGRPVVSATIVSHKGSTPRSAGARMAIREDGSIAGTIGGGQVEAEVLAQAAKVFEERKNRLLAFRLQGEEAAEADMLCGGEMEIYLEYFPAGDPSVEGFLKEVLDRLERGERPILVVPIEDGAPFGAEIRDPLFSLPEEWELEGPPSGLKGVPLRVQTVPREGRPVLVKVREQGREKRIYLERLFAPQRLILFGAGHVSAALCPLAKGVGFRVTVVDDRPEFAHPSRFPSADERLVLPFEEAPERIGILPSDFVVIMTRGHLHDQEVLRRVLPRRPAYLGMIGSRRKKETLFRALKEEGFSEDLLKTVHTPIGLPIEAETPEEIAVSIAAELIRVRAEKRKDNKPE